MERDSMQAVERICGRDQDSRTLREEIVSRLGRVIAHDAYCFATTDPWTLLFTDEVSAGIPPGGGSIATHNEYMVEDVDKFAELARSGRATGILGLSVRGDLERSHRFRTVLPMIEAKHELRIVFLIDRQCWGALSLFRGHASPDFTPHDANLLRAVSRPIAAALRRATCRPNLASVLSDSPVAPGVLLLDLHDQTMSANEAARRWLEELSPERMAVHEVASATRAGRGAEPYVRVRSLTGQWLSIWGSTMDGDHGGVSIVIQPAPTSDIARMLTLAYGLSPREQQVLQLVISGVESAAIAARLQVSPHTVQSHLKSLFAKFHVKSRGQLVSEIVGDLYNL